jgi:hypothetical protein
MSVFFGNHIVAVGEVWKGSMTCCEFLNNSNLKGGSMKQMLRMLIAGICVVGFVRSATAQITITKTDVDSILAAGRSLQTITDNSLATLNIGTAGSVTNSWDFSTLNVSSFQVLRSVSAGSSPWIANFPGATNAFRLDTSLSGISGSIYQYLQASSTQLLNMGAMARAIPFPGVSLEFRVFVTPNEQVYKLPATVGTNWATAFTNRTLITLTGSVLSDVSHTHNARYFIDAAGTMRIPGSTRLLYALRIRKINFYDNNPVGGYTFLSKGGALVQVETYDTVNTSGTIAITQGKTTWNTSVVPGQEITLGVDDGVLVPTQFTLKQNYPNPFNPSTTIQYEVPSERLVSLKVYNLIGAEVTTLVNEVKAPGSYAVSWNGEGVPSGVYFYKMQAGGFTATKRMLLIK